MNRQLKVGGPRTCKFTWPGVGQEGRWKAGVPEKLSVHQTHASRAPAKTTEPGTLCPLSLLGDPVSSVASEQKCSGSFLSQGGKEVGRPFLLFPLQELNAKNFEAWGMVQLGNAGALAPESPTY